MSKGVRMLGEAVVKAIFDEEYNRLYDAEYPVLGESETMELFDELNTGFDDHISLLFHNATDALFKIRHDVCSSDRECSAFIFTALRFGLTAIIRSLGTEHEKN